MKMSLVVTLLAIVLLASSPAFASPIVLYSSSTASASTATPGGAIVLFPPPATGYGPLGMVGGWDQGPVMLTIPSPSDITVSIEDCCEVGDIYSASWGSGIALPWTSIVPVGGPTNSTGTNTFFEAVAGTYAFNVTDLLLSYIGSPDPWGGGTVPVDYDPAGFTVEVTYSPVPEPGTLVLLGSGVLGFGGLLRRKFNL